jgi:hypothetical protein
MTSTPRFPLPDLQRLGLDLPLDEWQMTLAERCTLVTLLQSIRPEHAIEIGTARGGSLAVIARYSGRVYSIDPDPGCAERLRGVHANAEFLTGTSHALLPNLLARLDAEQAKLGFVLIDGEHTREAVQRDIEAVLRFRPKSTLYVILHDSFNPRCREGMLAARWTESSYVHAVDIDFLPGSLHSDPRYHREMWDGFACGLLLPSERVDELVIRQSHQIEYEALRKHSIWSPNPLYRLWARIDANRQRAVTSRICSPPAPPSQLHPPR